MSASTDNHFKTVVSLLAAGRAPTHREVGDAQGGRSKSTINEALVKLEEQGRLKRDYRKEAIFTLLVEELPASARRIDRETFAAIKTLLARLGRAPMYDEIAEELRLKAKSSAHDRVGRLKALGFVMTDYHHREVFLLATRDAA